MAALTRRPLPRFVAAALLALLPFPLESGSSDAAAADGGTPHRFIARGLSVVTPPGWRLARESPTPHLSDPHTVLSLGTGPIPVGGPCANVPTRAILAARRGAFVSLQERSTTEPGSLTGYPRRPTRFRLIPAGAVEGYPCVPEDAVRMWWRPFREGGRAFYLLVAVGRSAPPRVLRQARAAANSIRIHPGRTVGGGPWLRLPPGWDARSVPRAKRQVLHASTGPLPAGDGDDARAAQRALGTEDVLVSVARWFGPPPPQVGYRRARLPLRISRADFPAQPYEGQGAEALLAEWLVIDGQLLRLVVALGPGRQAPLTPAQRLGPQADRGLARVNALLRTLVLAPG